MGRCMASEPFGIGHVFERARTVSLHHLEQLHVAVQDQRSEEREHKQGTTACNYWLGCQPRSAGHAWSDKCTAAALAQHQGRSRSACRFGILANGACAV